MFIREDTKHNSVQLLSKLIQNMKDTVYFVLFIFSEKAVTEFVLKDFPNFTWSVDKKIQDRNLKRHPDLFLRLNEIIIVEIDENQYDGYVKIIESCWWTNGKGICVVEKTKENEWKTRLD